MASSPFTDDAIRERHGLSCRSNTAGEGVSHVMVWEREQGIVLNHENSFGAVMTPWQARYLASKLYRLARRVRQRNDTHPQSIREGVDRD